MGHRWARPVNQLEQRLSRSTSGRFAQQDWLANALRQMLGLHHLLAQLAVEAELESAGQHVDVGVTHHIEQSGLRLEQFELGLGLFTRFDTGDVDVLLNRHHVFQDGQVMP